MTARALLLVAVALAACDDADYLVRTTPVDDVAALDLDYGSAAGTFIDGSAPASAVVHWRGAAWYPSWPLGRDCLFGAGDSWRCYQLYRTPLSHATVYCWLLADGAFSAGRDRLAAVSWLTCSCEGSCEYVWTFVAAPILVAGEST